ncbi:POK8 protein, partial [Oenanthe oenanthe]|nr:POK8 protein [Oenanthe oenanthe]
IAADHARIVLPVEREFLERGFVNSVPLQSALLDFTGQIVYHRPSHKLLHMAKTVKLSLRPKHSRVPVQGPAVFTDGSGKTGKAIVTWEDESGWQSLQGHETGSAQIIELKAVTMAFQQFSQVPLNLVTDSAYVADITQCLDWSLLNVVDHAILFRLLKALWCAIQDQVHPYYVLHIRCHTDLPRLLTEGNARAHRLANPAWVALQPDKIAEAQASHGFFHQNAHTLQKQFHLTSNEAHDIVAPC